MSLMFTLDFGYWPMANIVPESDSGWQLRNCADQTTRTPRPVCTSQWVQDLEQFNSWTSICAKEDTGTNSVGSSWNSVNSGPRGNNPVDTQVNTMCPMCLPGFQIIRSKCRNLGRTILKIAPNGALNVSIRLEWALKCSSSARWIAP